jgi:FixJ family two-component response regulator
MVDRIDPKPGELLLDPKVLFVSGYTEVPVAQKLIEEGAILLQKPVSRSDLMRKVDEMLHLRYSSARAPNLSNPNAGCG